MNDTTKQMLTGLVRHFLTTAGGVLVANGWITEGGLEATAGGVAAIVVGLIWSLVSKRTGSNGG